MQFLSSAITRQRVILIVAMIAVFAAVGIANAIIQKTPPAPQLLIVNVLTLPGRGSLPPLHQVKDARLRDMIKRLSDVPAPKVFTDKKDIDLMVANILFRWAGADMAQKGIYGPYIDSRVAVFLQKIGSFPASYPAGTTVEIKDATNLNQTWFKVYERYRLLLLAQTAARSVYDRGMEYNINTDRLEIGGPISAKFIQDFQVDLESSVNSAEAMRAMLDFIDQTKGFDKLEEKEQDLIMSIHSPKTVAATHTAVPEEHKE